MYDLEYIDDYIQHYSGNADTWAALDEDAKINMLNQALLVLKSAYPCLPEDSFTDDILALQASYMTGGDYGTMMSGISRVAAAAGSVAVSWRTRRRGDGLSPIVFGLLGDPLVVCPNKKDIHLKVGRGI